MHNYLITLTVDFSNVERTEQISFLLCSDKELDAETVRVTFDKASEILDLPFMDKNILCDFEYADALAELGTDMLKAKSGDFPALVEKRYYINVLAYDSRVYDD